MAAIARRVQGMGSAGPPDIRRTSSLSSSLTVALIKGQEHGLRELPTAEYPDKTDGVTLKCTKTQEAVS